MNGTKKRKITALLIILIGIGVFTFPYARIAVADFLSSSKIREYEEGFRRMDSQIKRSLMEAAESYNAALRPDAGTIVDPFDVEGYAAPNPLENLDPNQEIGYVYIPAIEEKLPLYLGATDENLAKGVAQVEGSAIPMGVIGERPVIAGHRGYAKQAMFRYLDRLKEGDKIYIFALGKLLVYTVTDQEEIYPSENERLQPVANADMITLLTCTPFLQNYNRLLVNAVRDGTSYVPMETKSVPSTETEDPTPEPVDITERIREISAKSTVDPVAKRTKTLIYGAAAIGSIAWVVCLIVLIRKIITREEINA